MEKVTVKDSRMYSLGVLYDMHTDYFSKVIDGISDKDAHNRLNSKANHVAWLAGSLVQERFETARLLGIDRKPAADEFFKNHQGIKDDVTYPPLTEFKKDWITISPLLRTAFLNVSTEKLDSTFTMQGEDFSMPYFDLFAFMMYREANCIGQVVLYRRLLGYEPMRYM